MKWLLWIVAALLALAAIALVIGWLRPAGHVARTGAKYAAPPSEVWAVLTDFEAWGEWNPEITSMERLEDRDGRAAWLAKGGWGDLPTEIVRSEPPGDGSPTGTLETFVDGGAFQGTWVYELTPSGSGTHLRITERGEVSNPLFRAMMIFHDDQASMRAFHETLAGRLGEEVSVTELGEEVNVTELESEGG